MNKPPEDADRPEVVLTQLADAELELARKLAQMGRTAKTADEMIRLADAFERTALSIMSSIAMAAELSAVRQDAPVAFPDTGGGDGRTVGISLADLERRPDEPLQ